jgi:predicted aconitase with swiveling domain
MIPKSRKMNDLILNGCCVVSGVAEGEVLASDQPISFWGGLDPRTGCIHDPGHGLFGQSISGKILVFPFGKGSSTGSLIILELSRIHKAPAAIVNIRTELILATGPIVCKHFYGRSIPVLTLDPEAFNMLKSGQFVHVNASEGFIKIFDYLSYG